jgi:hypothetical protein
VIEINSWGSFTFIEIVVLSWFIIVVKVIFSSSWFSKIRNNSSFWVVTIKIGWGLIISSHWFWLVGEVVVGVFVMEVGLLTWVGFFRDECAFGVIVDV